VIPGALNSRHALVVIVAASALALAACGKKGAPEAPEGSIYPRTYPKPSTMILEGDLLAPTRTIQDREGLRDTTETYPTDTDFPEQDGLDDSREDEVSRERKLFPDDERVAGEDGTGDDVPVEDGGDEP
jgi:predicted small lipoprotein YifL